MDTELERFGAALRTMLGTEPWCIDQLGVEGGVLAMEGWALAPFGRHADLTFTVDDQDFAQVEFPLPRADIGTIFWFKEGSSEAAFRCRTPLATVGFGSGHATLRCVRRDTRRPLREEYDYYYPAQTDEPPLPDEARRRRVAGIASAEVFRLVGYTTLMKLERVLAAQGKRLRDVRSILDWGCGCGRITRYLPRFTAARITGVDIDADNLEWCVQQLPFGRFRRVPLRPPTELPASAFDLVIGVSVCTHLREIDQVAWLGELERVASPGALLLLTVHADTHVSWSNFSTSLYERWRERGFLVIEDKTDLSSHIDEKDYYVSAYMTRSHVEQSWSRFFEVRAIVPGLIGNHQDLVVLQKPG